MDLQALGLSNLDWTFVLGVLNIVLIDIILAGDNAVVIAMAVRSLPRAQRRKGIAIGAGAAVLLRVVLTFCVSQLLAIYLLKFIGGALISWIAIKLFVEGAPEDEGKEAATLGQAVRLIVVADITMSLDNVLAVAGASQGHFSLLIFGLALSIPFVVFTSNLLSYLMDRFPFIIYLGAVVLGRVAGEMIISDPFIVKWLEPSVYVAYGVEAFFAVAVIVAGKLLIRRKFRAQKSSDT